MINAKVLSINGCEATPPTIELIKTVAVKLNVDFNLTNIVIKTSENAHEERFIGSPTVQINGMDIEPSARDVESFGIT